MRLCPFFRRAGLACAVALALVAATASAFAKKPPPSPRSRSRTATVSASSKGPALKKSKTTEGARGQQIVLFGKNLPTTIDNISVTVGAVSATVTEAKADSLTFRLPNDAPLGPQPLSVTFTVGGKKGEPIAVKMADSKKPFTVTSGVPEPTLKPSASAEGALGQRIVLSGENLPTTADNISVTVGRVSATVTEAKADSLTFQLPNDAPLGEQSLFVTFTVGGKKGEPITVKMAGDKKFFTVTKDIPKQPMLKQSATTEGVRGQPITLSGENLPTTTDNISVTVGTVSATVTEAKADSLTFQLPNNAPLGEQSLFLIFTVGGKKGEPIAVKMADGKKFFTVISAAEQPTLKPSAITEGVRGKPIVLSGEYLPTTTDKVSVKVGTVLATVSEAKANSLTFQLPNEAPLGQQSLFVTFTVGEKKGEPVAVTMAGGKKFFTVTSAAPQPTLKPSAMTEGVRGQQIVLSGENLPTTIDNVSVKVGTISAIVAEAKADSLTFQLPDDAPLGPQPLFVTFTEGDKKGESIAVTMAGGKKYFRVINDQVGPLKLESVAPLVSYPTTAEVTDPQASKNRFAFRVLGQGFSRRGDDNLLEIENQGTLRIRWDETAENAEKLDRKKFDGRGFVVSDRELQIRDLHEGDKYPPLKLRVRVGDQVTETVPITFALVGKAFPFVASTCIVAVLLVIVVLFRSARRTLEGRRVGLVEQFLLDTETNTYSLSKLQFYLWTFAGIYGYCFLTLSRSLIQGHFELAEIPDGLPGIIGASAGTSILATGISGARGPKGAGPDHPKFADFYTSGGVVAPERFQFFVWTVVGFFSFVGLIALYDPASVTGLPKIPPGFLYMMGISSTGYLGGKFARKPGPIIDSIIAQINSPLKLEIRGRNLSKDAKFQIDGKEISYKLETGATQPLAAEEVEKDAILKVITKEDDSNMESFAKVVLLVIKNPDAAWLTNKTNLTISNPDGQEAVKPFEVKKSESSG